MHYRKYGESVENKEAFHWFAYTILPCVSARVINFAARKLREQISDVMSVSDEAFALLTLKNYEVRWRSQAENAHIEDVTERKSKWKSGQYTNGKIGHKKNKGWSKEGIKKYNEYFFMVQKQRKDEDRVKQVEVDFMEYCHMKDGVAIRNGGDMQVKDTMESEEDSDGEEVAYTDWEL